jgi:hypothetical protein
MGLWTVLFFILLIATDASALVGLITRFTEEGYIDIFIIEWHV